MILMEGPAGEVKHLADHMLSLRGVKHGKLVMTSAGIAAKKLGRARPRPHAPHPMA